MDASAERALDGAVDAAVAFDVDSASVAPAIEAQEVRIDRGAVGDAAQASVEPAALPLVEVVAVLGDSAATAASEPKVAPPGVARANTLITGSRAPTRGDLGGYQGGGTIAY